MSGYNATYHKRYHLDREQGISRSYVPAGPVRAHVARLVDAGLSARLVARLANVSPSTVCRVLDARYDTCQRAAATRLLAVTLLAALAEGSPSGLVPAVGTRRRIQALLALGWRHSDITAAMPTSHLSGVLLHQAGAQVTRETHDSVLVAYDALSMRPGPSAVTRRRSAALGHLPPLAWDDDAIDDPTAQPCTPGEDVAIDEVAVQRAINGNPAGPLTQAERRAVVTALAAKGMSDADIAKRAGCVGETVLRDRQILGIESRWSA